VHPDAVYDALSLLNFTTTLFSFIYNCGSTLPSGARPPHCIRHPMGHCRVLSRSGGSCSCNPRHHYHHGHSHHPQPYSHL
jgi:hypothetical protein